MKAVDMRAPVYPKLLPAPKGSRRKSERPGPDCKHPGDLNTERAGDRGVKKGQLGF